jgi:hypothetical protein
VSSNSEESVRIISEGRPITSSGEAMRLNVGALFVKKDELVSPVSQEDDDDNGNDGLKKTIRLAL